MANLKELRVRIGSVRSTQKITAAMKMVAASKLRRAQVAAEAVRPYADRMERMLSLLAEGLPELSAAPPLLAGTGKDEAHLLVPVSADRGLCGSFNTNVIRETRRRVFGLREMGKTVTLFCIGRKGREALRRVFGDAVVGDREGLMRTGVAFADAGAVADELVQMYETGAFDVCTFVFNRFESVISQTVTARTVIPVPVPEAEETPAVAPGGRALHILEPSDEEILAELLPRNVAVQVFRALLESFASEQGSRMTAMDSATRNAGEMIDSLTLTYNRTRQAQITKELIEIISGAEAI
ncbi:MAG: F0F1 ATP synthase subunit gamma [Rhodospirillales bacterium]|jgi:F-type H+-transporting ATPase subunit gamma|nr:F0F1 ATP synthase subunit gamma [Rhodospirillales bacterium]